MNKNEALETIAAGTAGISVAIDKATVIVEGLLIQHRMLAKAPAARELLKPALPALRKLSAACSAAIEAIEE